MTYTSNFLPIIFKVAHKKISMTRHIISISVREVGRFIGGAAPKTTLSQTVKADLYKPDFSDVLVQ
jgi:hypothetical protein